ncbi:MAG TPA: hypothetical protein VF529_10240 [Solirubrobacteraceae bacterium]|jgi:hypothetical protein
MRRTLIAAVAATALVAAAAQPAAALTTYSVAYTATDADGNKLNEGATARVVNDDASGMDIEFDCFANTTPPAISVSIGVQDCYIVGTNGARFDAENVGANPGTFTARAGVVLDAPRQRYRICVRANALIQGKSTFLQAPLVCSA